METERIEYIRKSNRKKKYIDKEGNEQIKVISRGIKKGVLYCGIDLDDPNSVIIGFSLCNSVDRFDYIQGKPMPGFGLETAKQRAEKWKLHVSYFIQNSFTEDMIEHAVMGKAGLMYKINPNPSEVVEIPPSINSKFKVFISRCRKYYKDKEFPEWIVEFEKGNPYPEDMVQEQIINLR